MEQRHSRRLFVCGTRSHHCFIPQTQSTLVMKRLSSDEEGAKVKLFIDDNFTSILTHDQLHQNLQLGRYIACMYDSVWYIGAVIEQTDQNKDVYIRFMNRNHLALTWPQDL